MKKDTMTIYMKELGNQDETRRQLARMLDDLWTWLDCDGVIVVRW